MNNIKAIFMDLDGTVLTSEHKVSENLIKKLRELEEKGVKIFIATGRTFISSKPFVEMLGIKNPVINYNGGRVTNPLNSEVVFEKPVEAEDVKELIKFVETVELAIRLGVDPRHADQQVRGTVVLPNGTGKNVKILTITSGENIQKALDAGSDYAGDDEYITKIQGGWMDFDLVIATPDMMPKLGKLGKILGTKGLMPNPKSGTVTTNVEQTVEEFKKGKVAFKVDKLGSLHLPLGKVNFTKEAVTENFKVAMEQIIKLKPAASKGQYLRSVAISLTMGPGIKVDPILVAAFVGK